MRRMFHLCAILALTLVIASPALAQQPGPGRDYVKELLLHLPSWAQNTEGTWDGMRKTSDGWEPTGTAIETSEPIWNHQKKTPYTRSIHEVTFTENPAGPPRTHTATVVFEDFGRNMDVPEWRRHLAPVLVTRGQEEIKRDSIRQPRWEYVKPN